MIDNYSFGEIVIDGREYDSDVLIYPGGMVECSWRRRDGHMLRMEDLRELLLSDPKTIIAGIGAYAMMRIEDDLVTRLSDAGIELVVLPTDEAVDALNVSADRRITAACLHLAC